MLPEVLPSSHRFGETAAEWFGAPVLIGGDAGDQQAATFGQACFAPGEAKNTYGTGCFMLMNTGDQPKRSQNNLLTTIGWGLDGRVTYCLEGSVFIAGAVVQWLRDGLGLIRSSAEVEALAATVPDSGGVVIVPAFTAGRSALGPLRSRRRVRRHSRHDGRPLGPGGAGVMAFQTRDLLEAMQRDAGIRLDMLKVDGGASVNDLLMQFQADILDTAVRRPVVAETTALGAAYLAGLAVGYWNGLDDIARTGPWTANFARRWLPKIVSGDVPAGPAPWAGRWTGKSTSFSLRAAFLIHPQDLLADLFVRASLLQRHESAFAQTAKPGLLMAGELPGAGFDRLDRRGQVPLPAEVFDHLAVTDRLQPPCG